jgi:hypothetical protein
LEALRDPHETAVNATIRSKNTGMYNVFIKVINFRECKSNNSLNPDTYNVEISRIIYT